MVSTLAASNNNLWWQCCLCSPLSTVGQISQHYRKGDTGDRPHPVVGSLRGNFRLLQNTRHFCPKVILSSQKKKKLNCSQTKCVKGCMFKNDHVNFTNFQNTIWPNQASYKLVMEKNRCSKLQNHFQLNLCLLPIEADSINIIFPPFKIGNLQPPDPLTSLVSKLMGHCGGLLQQG